MILSAPSDFSNPDEIIPNLLKNGFENLLEEEKFDCLCRSIYNLVHALPQDSFALVPVLKLIEKINQEKLLDEPFRFNNFELWLNALGNISQSDNLQTRFKIAGRFIPRNEYQNYFPINENKYQWGTHIVTGHSSPDLDTAVASFWSWVDAFAAKITTGLHVWNLPGNRLSDHDSRVFHQYFEKNLFQYLPKGKSTLTLQALDLMTPSTLVKLSGDTLISSIENSLFEKGVILVNKDGSYKGDWRASDVLSVQQITAVFSHILREFETHLGTLLISLFARPKLTKKEAKSSVEDFFKCPLINFELPLSETEIQKQNFEKFLKTILNLEIHSNFYDLAQALKSFSLTKLESFISSVINMTEDSSLFDIQGHLIEDRTHLLTSIEKKIEALSELIHSVESALNTLEMSMRIKTEVLCAECEYISSKADIEEIKNSMKQFSYLTVVYQTGTQKLIPIGVIYNETLKRKFFGTVSQRDFSNRDEVKLSDYLEVISVIDHHKSDVRCSNAPVAIISNTQSCNTLLAEMQMAINDKYSHLGQSLETIQSQIKELLSKKEKNLTEKRQLIRLMTRESVVSQNLPFFVSPERESMEYTMYLYAILDDTDLLAKAGPRDLRVASEIINRLETIKTGQDSVELSFEDIENSSDFTNLARSRLLQNKSMYTLYSQFYAFKESSIREQILLCTQGQNNSLFCDTKTQNNCARIGQVKLTKPLASFFNEHKNEIIGKWAQEAQEIFIKTEEVDLHIQMISTTAGAEDVYQNQTEAFTHKDMLWIWSPLNTRANEHLITFLRGLKSAKEVENLSFEIDIFSQKPASIQSLLEENFVKATLKVTEDSSLIGSLLVLHFKAGALNSRKAVISPYLPV